MALMRPDQAKPGQSRPETIEELFEALESPLLGYALGLVGERGLAEDIVQEAFMRLHQNFAEVRHPQAWLYRTARNLALNRKRADKKIVQLGTEDGGNEEATDPQPFPDEQIAHCEGIGLVRLTLKTLDERSRNLIHLKFHEGLSYKQISARTGLTIGHVGYLLHHAIKTMAAELARNGMLP